MPISSYERIKKFVPVFYQDVVEMDAIYKVDGEMVDDLLENIKIIKANRYILSADENEISELEAFLGLYPSPESTIEERRRLIVAYYTGFGKISATTIKNIIKSMSEAESTVDFSSSDEAGNNRLNIDILKPVPNYNLDDIIDLLSKRIPGHICYRISVYHEKSTQIYVGTALQNGTNLTMKISGVDPDDYDWLTDENGDYLMDENGLILFDKV